jgi:hypothetical protein
MLSNPISAKVIFALALAILMAWAGHTSALFVGASQSVLTASDDLHAHAHGDGAFACAACADHFHSPLTADHVHETPHLSSLLSVDTVAEGRLLIDAPRYFFPAGPIFLIERPPRASSIL